MIDSSISGLPADSTDNADNAGRWSGNRARQSVYFAFSNGFTNTEGKNEVWTEYS